MCINSVKDTCFSQKYKKWIYQVLEMSSSIVKLCKQAFLQLVQLLNIEVWLQSSMTIPSVPEKAERQIFSTLRSESAISFYIIK